jgi:hypothetical protein
VGFWSRLFGERETAEQKLARARGHVDDGEPNLALAIVEPLDGPEVDELRHRARALAERLDRDRALRENPRRIGPDRDDPLRAANAPPSIGPDPDDPLRDEDLDDPYRGAAKEGKRRNQPTLQPGELSIQFGADGSTTIGTGDGAVTLNAPISDDDGRPRSADALDVAGRVLASTGAQELDTRGFAFVEACVVCVRAGQDLPRMSNPQRAAIAGLVVAAHSREPARIAAFIRAAHPAVAEDVAWFATPLAVQFAAKELGALVLDGLVKPTTVLLEALVRDEPRLCAEIVTKVGEPWLIGEALLLGELPGLTWADCRQPTEEWRALEIRRLVRTGELDAALALEQTHADEHGPHYTATFELARALAKLDAASATTKVLALDPHIDYAGWLTGLARAGIGVEVVDRWIEALDSFTYDPFTHFAQTLAACIDLGDVTRARHSIAKGGPTGWQIACAAHDALGRAHDRQSLLAACYERAPAGVVAGRAVAYGAFPFGAGKIVSQPAWLAFTDPHPIETLALVAALGGDMPRWP